ncbi:MAG: hypothetical protein IJ113_00305 [Eggerthellaceae bacterium]|nr:hypothetical protein [Eggerthellaceae bacterium]
MKVKLFYDNGSFDIFETESHADKIFRNNVITDYSFDLMERNDQELWMTIYYQEAADEFKNDIGPTQVPVSHRRDGWAVLLADSRDMKRLRHVSIDGEVVLIRLFDELIDRRALEYTSDLCYYFAPRVVAVYDFLESVLGKEHTEEPDAEICEMLALSPATVKQIMEWNELAEALSKED